MKISLTGKENVYEQIVNEYKRYIEMNVYRYDEKLPTCRDLAKQLGVNPNTVSKAYTKLEELGYIKAIPKKGTNGIRYLPFLRNTTNRTSATRPANPKANMPVESSCFNGI